MIFLLKEIFRKIKKTHKKKFAEIEMIETMSEFEYFLSFEKTKSMLIKEVANRVYFHLKVLIYVKNYVFLFAK